MLGGKNPRMLDVVIVEHGMRDSLLGVTEDYTPGYNIPVLMADMILWLLETHSSMSDHRDGWWQMMGHMFISREWVVRNGGHPQ